MDSNPTVDRWYVGVRLIGPGLDEGPRELARVVGLRLRSNIWLHVLGDRLAAHAVNVPFLCAVHVHPARWPLVMHQYRLERARFEVRFEDFGGPPLRLLVDAHDAIDHARRARAATLEILTGASEVPSVYYIVDRQQR